jgi:hypothetical protein
MHLGANTFIYIVAERVIVNPVSIHFLKCVNFYIPPVIKRPISSIRSLADVLWSIFTICP